MTRTRKIFIGCALLVVIGLLVVVIVRKRAPVTVPSGAVNGLPSDESSSVGLPIFKPYNPYPNDARIDIGTSVGSVSTRNFYPDALDQDEATLVLYKREGYTVTYDTVSSGFWIAVKGGAAYDDNRARAESRFTSMLDISQAEACKLTVTVATQYSTDAALYRAPRRLSFCF